MISVKSKKKYIDTLIPITVDNPNKAHVLAERIVIRVINGGCAIKLIATLYPSIIPYLSALFTDSTQVDTSEEPCVWINNKLPKNKIVTRNILSEFLVIKIN